MTTEEQDAATRVAFYNKDTMPKETELQDAIGKKTPNLVKPRNKALVHPAAYLLEAYATEGCPKNYGPDWTTDHIAAALRRGPHPSANSSAAMATLHSETAENIKNGYAKVVRYGDIKGNTPVKLKISPIKMIPHKLLAFRNILDLPFSLKHNGKLMDSVNSATTKQALAESMIQLGPFAKRLIATLADKYNPNRPFRFSKLDIKYGFWRLQENKQDAWNFGYVLLSFAPTKEIYDINIVIPNCLHMGWCKSPPFFCAASETARDIIESLLQEVSLPDHPFGNHMLDIAQDSARHQLTATASFISLMEVFVDNFIGMTNNSSQDHLRRFSRTILIVIHSVLPPPELSGHQVQEPVSLVQGGGVYVKQQKISWAG